MCYSDDICNVVLPFEKEKHNMPSTRNCSNPPPQKESTNVRWQPCFVAPSFRHSLLHETIWAVRNHSDSKRIRRNDDMTSLWYALRSQYIGIRSGYELVCGFNPLEKYYQFGSFHQVGLINIFETFWNHHLNMVWMYQTISNIVQQLIQHIFCCIICINQSQQRLTNPSHWLSKPMACTSWLAVPSPSKTEAPAWKSSFNTLRKELPKGFQGSRFCCVKEFNSNTRICPIFPFQTYFGLPNLCWLQSVEGQSILS